jgi:hypothetical protein
MVIVLLPLNFPMLIHILFGVWSTMEQYIIFSVPGVLYSICLHKNSLYKVKGAWKCVDPVTELLDIWSELPFQPLATHVYGHRDERIGPLIFLESLNSLAKSIAFRHLGQLQRLPQISCLGYGTITVGGTLVSSRLQ